MKIETTKELKTALRQGEYAWPGGYPIFFVMSDGQAASFDGVRGDFKNVIYSMRHNENYGYSVVGIEINYENEFLTCCFTNELIDCAYCED